MKKSVKFFLDTANLDDIKGGITLGVFSGVTTNPVIVSKETHNYKDFLIKILDTIPKNWELSAEVKAGNTADMVKQAKLLAVMDKRIRVKLPTNVEGLKAAEQLIEKIPLNMTVVKLPAQAMMCQALAARHKPKDILLSVFCGRINQAGYDWRPILEKISQVDWPGKILAASIKTPFDIAEAVAHGAEIVTAPLDVYQTSLSSKLVQEDVDLFNKPFDGKDFEVR
ncbi:MAG: putative transaldolase [Candidatus Jorgensenbacteria bacterium GW2011_GWA1_48_11]|uniref:Putative transaldolase n=1 Tax=Candidatus Jorgensenbacteria bacterium GW2011_GWA1_48_11 TaxID=1618660 RepID=A0A0G1UCC1_9BACT|nr:MAG: putative transaldolase [Candidatus Jorgensenbacteria bacterium GW2011_GWA1_48_11]KKW12258.1 MAG: putative transaldolase [Candidatus Jorgensenbacteria bacterium GW2011_GWB1_49_9]